MTFNQKSSGIHCFSIVELFKDKPVTQSDDSCDEELIETGKVHAGLCL